MASPSPQIKFTYEDYLLFPEDGKRHELIEGDHYITPAPKTKHQKVSSNLLGLLYAHLQRTKAGRVFSAPTDVAPARPHDSASRDLRINEAISVQL